ncbi:protein FAR1-RELATED SEQUENCE 1-like [Telopea speciosissima]|uniref:protein FAR1-RELATED SEQUENCE 1-like n=1 Tax=Telopea speciosissima TaxID=54955 RepID=UPI001CC45760|nr:protein FAR1-RELATED SEQUENCE 1-like [Telopea speciosissima]
MVGDFYIKFRNESSVCREYVVVVEDVDEEFHVICNPFEPMIVCSCRKFETYGVLCSHAPKILDVLDIKKIPESYVLRRWTRGVRNIEVEDIQRKLVKENMKLDYTQRYNVLCPLYIKLISQASTSNEGYTLDHKNAHELSKQLQNLQCNEEDPDDSAESPIVQLQNKGLKKKEKSHCGKRMKSRVEMQKKKANMGGHSQSHGAHQSQPNTTSYPVQMAPSYIWHSVDNSSSFTTPSMGHIGYSHSSLYSSQGSTSVPHLS